MRPGNVDNKISSVRVMIAISILVILPFILWLPGMTDQIRFVVVAVMFSSSGVAFGMQDPPKQALTKSRSKDTSAVERLNARLVIAYYALLAFCAVNMAIRVIEKFA